MGLRWGGISFRIKPMQQNVKKMTTLEIKYKKINDLIPYANNSRTHSEEQVTQIASSIKEFGWTNPVLLDGENGIIAGHGRLMAAKKLGFEEVPTIELAGLSEHQKKAYIIADNKLSLNAGWDEQILKLEIAELQDAGFDLSLTGFSEKELKEFNPEIQVGLTEDDEVPPPPVEAKTKLGDIYVLGNHRLMCGDSTNIDSVEKLTEGLVDILVTDPPYNVNYEGSTKDKLTIMNDSMEDEQFRQFLRDAFVAANAVMKEGAVFYIWHADLKDITLEAHVKMLAGRCGRL